MTKSQTDDKSPEKSIKNKTDRKFLYLLISIIFLLIAYPLTEGGTFGRVFYGILLTAIPLTGIYAIRDKTSDFVLSLVLGVLALLAIADGIVNLEIFPGDFIEGAVILLFYIFITIKILAYVLREKDISKDTVFGGLCVYLLFGWIWTIAYAWIENLQPGSFHFAVSAGHTASDERDFIYYSYTTLTTLGYGDITPISSQARSLAVLESITGVLYLTVFIARLVATQVSKSIHMK